MTAQRLTDPHTSAEPYVVEERWPPSAGRLGFAQGGYGERGNLELVTCDPQDGLWVGWFNTDRAEHRAGAPLGRWSSALRFGQGHRYVAAGILQVEAGPDWIESLGLTDQGELRRLVWSPQDGYVDRGVIAVGVRHVTRLERTPGGEHICVIAEQGTATVLRASPRADYPELEWVREDLGPVDGVLLDSAVHDGHIDLMAGRAGSEITVSCQGERLIARSGTTGRFARRGSEWVAAFIADGEATVCPSDTGPVLLGPADALEVASVGLDGVFSWHVMTRRGSGLVHHHQQCDATSGPPGSRPAEIEWASRTVVSYQWVTGPRPATIHRPLGPAPT